MRKHCSLCGRCRSSSLIVACLLLKKVAFQTGNSQLGLLVWHHLQGKYQRSVHSLYRVYNVTFYIAETAVSFLSPVQYKTRFSQIFLTWKVGWVTTREDWVLWTWVRLLVWTKSVTDHLYRRYCADTNIKWIKPMQYIHRNSWLDINTSINKL